MANHVGVIDFTNPRNNLVSKWYLVCLTHDKLGVVADDDLSDFIKGEHLQSAVELSYEQACIAANELSKGAFMSANHRIKAGESGGVG
jgi:hypothetical protein